MSRAPFLYYGVCFDLGDNPGAVLAIFQADTGDVHATMEPIIPKGWEQTEASTMPRSAWVKYEADDPFDPKDVERVHRFIEEINKTCNLMRR